MALTIHDDPFIHFTDDNSGNVFYCDVRRYYVETPIAKAVGEVYITSLDHHENRDASNKFLEKA